ncbi:MAG TPA: SIS domain-containing protein [Longimicrobiaceae bacterium]|nr:SIS domain-containing protein [Longimicrobiaceae bacterium]
MTDPRRLQIVGQALDESAGIKQALRAQSAQIVDAADRLVETFRAGNRLYACGNGGSASDAMHLVEELVARYKRTRPGIPAHHLLDGPTLTCWSNDFDFETAFQRQVETLIRPGDVLVAISTSGNSANVLLAAKAARAAGAWTLGLTGGTGGQLAEAADLTIRVPSAATERVQEAHICIIHILCELVETALYGDGD